MKKTILLSAAILALSALPANASSFSFGIFSPAPVYVAPPQPVYVQQYPVAYANPYYAPVTYSYYPANYNYVYYNGWNNRGRHYDRHDRREWRERHDNDGRGRW